MKIIKKENRIYFEYKDISYANISINNDFIKIELIKTNTPYRSKGFASKMLVYIIDYINKHYKSKTKIILSPLPLDHNCFNIEQLISFYSRYKFFLDNNSDKFTTSMIRHK